MTEFLQKTATKNIKTNYKFLNKSLITICACSMSMDISLMTAATIKELFTEAFSHLPYSPALAQRNH
jgi:hypothetical protein